MIRQVTYRLLSRGDRMVIVLALYVGGRGSIPRRVEMLGSVSVNHSLTVPRCKNGTSKCGEDRNQSTSPAWSVKVGLVRYAPCSLLPARK